MGAPDPVTSEVPTPYPSTGAAASAAIEYSLRSPLSTILVSRAPSWSSSVADLPGHHRQVAAVDADRAEPGPGQLHRGADRAGHVEVSTSRVVPLPSAFSWAAKASRSLSWTRVNACALVPLVGMP